MHIIQQIAEELVEKIAKKASGEELSDIDALAAEIFEDCADTARALLSEIIRERNERLRHDKAFRKERGLVLKEKDRPRALLTKLGLVEWGRDYYYDAKAGGYTYPLDAMLGVRGRQRIGDEVCAGLLSKAADFSYGKSAGIVTGGAVSRQSVRSHLLGADIPEKGPEAEGREVAELHIYADEDHVHMQRPGKERGKLNVANPLVTVTEGTEPAGARRNRTVRPMHFVDERQSPEGVWKGVEGYIERAYDTDALERIYIHSDGGKWIGGGLGDFPQVIRVFDGYHFHKELNGVARDYPDMKVKAAILGAVRDNDKAGAGKFLHGLSGRGGSAPKFRAYLFGHWDEIRNLLVLDVPGSCTEGQVSHVLSERFSRNPMGWSREGLGKLSKLRVYLKNGGRLTGKDMKPEARHERYGDYAEWFMREQSKGAKDWGIFEKDRYAMDASSGTQKLLKIYGTDHGVLCGGAWS